MIVLWIVSGFVLCALFMYAFNARGIMEAQRKYRRAQARAGKDTGYKNNRVFYHDNLLYRFCGCGVGSDSKGHIPAFKPADLYGQRCGVCGCVLLLEE